ncbi:hypothetical protein [Caldanaerobius fijiensis]|uniref:hypothetical protein n=1 Tax=Caldanaerobius fijiensis TaxID=456330 RepID=UPI001F2846DF|nr:hypothetical protein [Caldanaerobius fijiensis]
MGELIPIKEIIIKNGAINSISHVVDKVGVTHCKVMVVCDNNTYNVAGKYVASQLESGGYDVVECVLEREARLYLTREPSVKSL